MQRRRSRFDLFFHICFDVTQLWLGNGDEFGCGYPFTDSDGRFLLTLLTLYGSPHTKNRDAKTLAKQSQPYRANDVAWKYIWQIPPSRIRPTTGGNEASVRHQEDVKLLTTTTGLASPALPMRLNLTELC